MKAINRFRNIISAITIITLSFLNAFGQEFQVVNFDSDKTDLTARTQPRVDNNGRKCAVVKVYVEDSIAAVRGSAVGKISGVGMEKLIYLVHDATQMELVFDKHLPLKIVFMDYGIPSLTGQMTYICKLKTVSEANIQNSETSTSHTVIDLQDKDDSSISLSSIESILGCRFATLEIKEMKKLKLKEGVIMVDILKDGPLKDAGLKEHFILRKINGKSVDSTYDLIQLWDNLQESFQDSDKVLIIMGIYPNGKKGYYAVKLI